MSPDDKSPDNGSDGLPTARPIGVGEPPSSEPGFPVVAIGASAGGLEALKEFLDAMPAHSGVALVVIQHLAPYHQSLTAELLASHTAMPVREAAEGVVLEVDHVYVIPPNAYLEIRDGTLHLSDPVPYKGVRMPIDHFFRSLAQDQQELAIGVLLSGTGSDGTLGLREIKCGGGMSMVQDPATAQHGGMIRSAIESGQVDHVSAIGEMPERLMQYVRHTPDQLARQGGLKNQEAFQRILALLLRHSSYDFTGYKEGTTLRRIARRMGLKQVSELSAYADYLQGNGDELTELFQDLLISVTGFFRDPEAFDILVRDIVGPLVQRKGTGEAIRVWVPGCATGEEAYSLAMLFLETLSGVRGAHPLQIFATDIDERAMEFARVGLYPETALAELPAERVQRFFVKEDSTFRVTKRLRECVTFARHSVVADPPFSRPDLISCRNLLIYLRPELQQKLLSLFHFALAPGGFLFLGGSETAGIRRELFKTIDQKWRIYQRLEAPRQHITDFPTGFASLKSPLPGREPAQYDSRELSDSLETLAHRQLLNHFAPASLVVDSEQQIRYYHGPFERYLKRPPGAPTNALLPQCREGLRARLVTVLQEAREEGRRAVAANCSVRMAEGDMRRVRITAEPLRATDGERSLLLVVFEDEAVASGPKLEPYGGRGDKDLVQQLEQELRSAQEELNTTYEEFESTNEELKSANEEILSMNEELQSTNEELESSKEELQSMNEELNTINAELQVKVEELSAVNNDLNNLLSSTDIATLFLDRQGCIKRFTPATRTLFKLIATDLGRPIDDIAQQLQGCDLREEARTVLQNLTPLERHVRDKQGNWYLQRMLPYRTERDSIEGTVVTFQDITRIKRDEQSLRQLTTAFQMSGDAITVMDFDGRILDWNRGAEQMYGWPRELVLGKPIFTLIPTDRIEATRTFLRRLRDREPVDNFETRRLTREGDTVDVSLNLTVVTDDEGEPLAVVATERDISKRVQAEQTLERARSDAESANLAKTTFLTSLSHDLRQPLQALLVLNASLASSIDEDIPLALLREQDVVLRLVANLLDAILHINLMSSGRQRVAKSDFGIDGLFSELKSEFGCQARDKGLTLRVRGSSAVVHSDRQLVHRILGNLMANAIKYTRAGKILLGCRRRRAGICIEVWDTGCGMDGAETARIFNEFYQVDTTWPGHREGMGLGLTIARRFAEFIGSSVGVRSRPGRGSVFSVELPLSGTPREGSEDFVDAAQDEPCSTPGLTVLLIEDDALVASTLVSYLTESGFNVVHFRSGEAALAQLRQEASPPDVLLCDYRLPESRNGLDVIDETNRFFGASVPAILLTGDRFTIDVEEVRKRGCRLLYKPADPARLVDTIRRQAAKRGRGGNVDG